MPFGTARTKPGFGKAKLTAVPRPPYITNIVPSSGNAVPFALNVYGSGFTTGSFIFFDGIAQSTTYGSPTNVACMIDLLGAPGPKIVRVFNNPGWSNEVNFTVIAAEET